MGKTQTEPKKIYIWVYEGGGPAISDSWDFTTMSSADFSSEFSYTRYCALSSGIGLVPSGAGSDEAFYCSKLITNDGSQYDIFEGYFTGQPASWSWMSVTFYNLASQTIIPRKMFGINNQNYGASYCVKDIFVLGQNYKLSGIYSNYDSGVQTYGFKYVCSTGAWNIYRNGTSVANGTASSTYQTQIRNLLNGNVYVYIGGQYAGGSNVLQSAEIKLS